MNTNIDDIKKFWDKNFLLIGCPLRSGIDEVICEMVAYNFMWEDFKALLLVKSQEYEIIKKTIEDQIKKYGFTCCKFQNNTISLHNSSIVVVDTNTTNHSHKGISDFTYIHLFDGDPGILKNLKTITDFSEKLWISTLDYEGSLWWDKDIPLENKIKIQNENTQQTIETIRQKRPLNQNEKMFYGEFESTIS